MWQASYTHRLIGAAAATTVFANSTLSGQEAAEQAIKDVEKAAVFFFWTFVSLGLLL